MAKATTTTIDTSAGSAAYALAIQHQTDLQPRLPAATLANLAADLTLLGAAPPAPAQPAGQSPPPQPPAPAAPSLADATAAAVALITAIHAAIRGAKPSSGVRKAYGTTGKASKEPKAVVAEGQKILAQAQADPSQALSLGILPADTTALGQALAALASAETVAKGKGGTAGTTAKELRAAEVRMHEAVARIAGVGALAFATNAAVRAQFEALEPKKKKA
jgi:hypothetical protein